MSLSAQIVQKIAADFAASLDVGTVKYSPNYGKTTNFVDGTGANQANQIFTDTRTLTASASENLDLAGGLTDAFGNTVTFTKVKGILLVAAAGNTNNVNLTRPASNGVPIFLAASDGIGVQPDGAVSIVAPSAAGYTVTASTGDIITVANSGGGTAVTYTIVIVGTV